MLRIQFANWREYLLRHDLVNVQWIRIPTSIVRARQLHGLPPHTRWMLIYFLSEAGEQNENGKLDIEIDYVAHYNQCSFDEILYSAEVLAERGYFTLEVDDNTMKLVEEARFTQFTHNCAESARTRAPSAQTRAECARPRADHARTRVDDELNNDDQFNPEELLDFTESARARAESARTRAGSGDKLLSRVRNPHLEKRREEKKREEERREREEESLRETNFDAAGGGSLSLANSGSKKSKTRAVQVMDLSDAELELGTQWLKLAVTHFPNRATDPKWTPHLFALDLRKVANVCSYTIADMQKVLEYIKHDTFWANKAACPSGLLKKGGNGLRKIENIFAQTKSKAQIKDAQTAQEWAENPEKAAEWQEMLAWIGGKKP